MIALLYQNPISADMQRSLKEKGFFDIYQ